MAGVARRRNIPLRYLRVEIELHRIFQDKTEAERAAAEGIGLDRKRKVVKRVIVGTAIELSERDVTVLRNTIKYCPVGRMFSGGNIEWTEELRIEKVEN